MPPLFCPVLCCPLLCCPVLCCPLLCYPILSSPVLSCPVLCPALLYFTLTCLALPWLLTFIILTRRCLHLPNVEILRAISRKCTILYPHQSSFPSSSILLSSSFSFPCWHSRALSWQTSAAETGSTSASIQTFSLLDAIDLSGYFKYVRPHKCTLHDYASLSTCVCLIRYSLILVAKLDR